MSRTRKLVYAVLAFPFFWVLGGMVVHLLALNGVDGSLYNALRLMVAVGPFAAMWELYGRPDDQPSTRSK